MVPTYGDDEFYVDELAVSDNNIITASGLGSLEFAREVFRELNVFGSGDLEVWYDMFKTGAIPASMPR